MADSPQFGFGSLLAVLLFVGFLANQTDEKKDTRASDAKSSKSATTSTSRDSLTLTR